jgi:hypothetical protein
LNAMRWRKNTALANLHGLGDAWYKAARFP